MGAQQNGVVGASVQPQPDLSVRDRDPGRGVQESPEDVLGLGLFVSGQIARQVPVQPVGNQRQYQIQVDLDGDRDLDIVGAAMVRDEIVWWENDLYD